MNKWEAWGDNVNTGGGGQIEGSTESVRGEGGLEPKAGTSWD